MRDLRLGFTDTYTNCINFFTDILGRRYNVIRDDQDPDYLIFGDANFGTNHLNYTRPHKIFFTGENVRPNYSECDVALTFDHENSPRHYRLPLYVLEMWAINKDNNVHGKFDYLYLTHRDIDYEKEWDQKTNFSAYVQSNPYCQQRNLFVMMLLDAGLLASSGPHLNTTGIILPRDRTLKLDFFHQAKFGIAMENGAHPGYVTEKLIDCYYANTVPIYWLSLIHISEPTRQAEISYAVFCLK